VGAHEQTGRKPAPGIRGSHQEGLGGNLFRREGEYWTISYDGVLFRLRDLKGLRCLARLLGRPGERISAVELLMTEHGDEAPASAEKARLAVTRRIKTAIEKMAPHHPSLAHHLSTTVRTGSQCLYRPDPVKPIRWEL
jgi:hypothetical protein